VDTWNPVPIRQRGGGGVSIAQSTVPSGSDIVIDVVFEEGVSASSVTWTASPAGIGGISPAYVSNRALVLRAPVVTEPTSYTISINGPFAGSTGSDDKTLYVEVVPPGDSATLSIPVSLADYTGFAGSVPIEVALTPTGGGTTLTYSGSPNRLGVLTLNGLIPPGNYSVRLKGETFLRKTLSAVALNVGDNSLPGVTLTNGDCDGDNEVTILDYLLLSAAFETNVLSANFEPRADLDGDGEVSILDYLILSGNFERVGDN
jgi:hypothetical protein